MFRVKEYIPVGMDLNRMLGESFKIELSIVENFIKFFFNESPTYVEVNFIMATCHDLYKKKRTLTIYNLNSPRKYLLI